MVKKFLSYGYGDSNGNGSGYGNGSGNGGSSGYGSCIGSGDGSCIGSGDGSGIGSGDGSGYGYDSSYGYGIKSINGTPVYLIDDVPTIINCVKGAVAKGAILKDDLSLEPCYIVKQGAYYAHGETLRKAMEALRDKLFEDMPEDERIEAFVTAHDEDKAYPNMDFFDWHHKLTGSCEMGRKAFAERHGVDLEGSMTVSEFISLTEHDYGGDVIRRLREFYPEKRAEEENG